MSDVLSQSEIDALLTQFESGGIIEMEAAPEENVREYDFRTASRFHKDQIRTLNNIYETFARLFATYLSGTLRVMCTAEVTGLEELKYQEFVNALPTPVILAILHQPPLVGPVILELSPDITFSLIARLLGGSSHPREVVHGRDFTEIEMMLLNSRHE
jgi:flagellar motor switch protein FliM